MFFFWKPRVNVGRYTTTLNVLGLWVRVGMVGFRAGLCLPALGKGIRYTYSSANMPRHPG